jgi:hypothetical protein
MKSFDFYTASGVPPSTVCISVNNVLVACWFSWFCKLLSLKDISILGVLVIKQNSLSILWLPLVEYPN